MFSEWLTSGDVGSSRDCVAAGLLPVTSAPCGLEGKIMNVITFT